MKSLRESFKSNRWSVPSISSTPKTAVPIVEYREENDLVKLWMDVSKSEEVFRRLLNESEKYLDSLRSVQDSEEKLLHDLGVSKIGVYSSSLCEVNDEYLSVVMKTKALNEDIHVIMHEVMEVAPAQYHSLYEHLENSCKKREALINDIHKAQERFDRLKLKGKRTTDVMVEKERLIRQLKTLNSKLLVETKKFHEARIPFLMLCLQTSTLGKINHCGNVASAFNECIERSRHAHHVKDAQYSETVNFHLKRIQDLKIVN